MTDIKDRDNLLLMYRVVNRWLDAHADFHNIRRGKIGRGLRMDLKDIMEGEYCGPFGMQYKDYMEWSEPSEDPLDD